ncbi:phospholipase [Podospora fimiseda]|uniref:Phospholipase n=1 Tax=Podospora fimiseda TaxID=252190 RepID=A0AAN7BED1_9PEZI|nr:phospholipase [Podospora fimiseda]
MAQQSTPPQPSLSAQAEEDLCLLSLDGGGVRGLSSLYILSQIMEQLNIQREELEVPLPKVKPCEIFDLIGGTSTGGLIALMLGRLEMDVDACIETYLKLMNRVFVARIAGAPRMLPFNLSGKVQPRYQSDFLRGVMSEVIMKNGESPDALLFSMPDYTQKQTPDVSNMGTCKVFVCAKKIENAPRHELLRTYALKDTKDFLQPTIIEAAMATTAAPTFFEKASVGKGSHSQKFVDGSLGTNNPVEEVYKEARNRIWKVSNKPPVTPKCLISLGTGRKKDTHVEDSLYGIIGTMKGMITDADERAESFLTNLGEQGFYFLFTVHQDLVRMDEADKLTLIRSKTIDYLDEWEIKKKRMKCVKTLVKKKPKSMILFALEAGEQALRRFDFNEALIKYAEAYEILRTQQQRRKQGWKRWKEQIRKKMKYWNRRSHWKGSSRVDSS